MKTYEERYIKTKKSSWPDYEQLPPELKRLVDNIFKECDALVDEFTSKIVVNIDDQSDDPKELRANISIRDIHSTNRIPTACLCEYDCDCIPLGPKNKKQ